MYKKYTKKYIWIENFDTVIIKYVFDALYNLFLQQYYLIVSYC